MKRGSRTKNVSKLLNKTQLDLSDPKGWTVFFMQLAMEPYSQLGTGARCKVKGCGQPVYDPRSGLCSYHRMRQQEETFENRLKARKQSEN